MREALERWFAYDHWANRQTLRSLQAGSFSERIRKIMAHVPAAERLWHDRLLGRPQSMAVWPDLTLDQSAALVDEMAERWREYLAGLPPEGLQAVKGYTNSQGEPWRNTVQDVLVHVVMHSGYHRGQIAAAVRAEGGEPAHTDFIEAVRRGYLGDGERGEGSGT
jgi:uncharacterized damage-inducible protein DinB